MKQQADVVRWIERHLLTMFPEPTTVERTGDAVLINHVDEITVRLEPDRFWMQTVRTRWHGQQPVPEADRELSVSLRDLQGRGPNGAALEVMALVHVVFGARLGSYSKCVDCGKQFAPEQMTGQCCHGCAHDHGVVY